MYNLAVIYKTTYTMYTLPFKFDLGDRIHISLPYMNFFIMYCSPVHYKIQSFGQLLFVLRLFQMNLVALNKININLRHSFQEHSYKKSILTSFPFFLFIT